MKTALIVKYNMPSNLGFFNYPRLTYDLGIDGIEIISNEHLDDVLEKYDLCLFGFADEMLKYASKSKHKAKMITWCRGFEIFSPWLTKIDWQNVDRLIFSGANLPDIFSKYNKENPSDLSKVKVHIIPTGVDMDAMNFRERKPGGFNLAFIGHLTYKKNLTFLIYAFQELHRRDSRYKLHIAGEFVPYEYSQRFKINMEYLISVFNLENDVMFHGWQKDINSWLEDKDYLVHTTLLESGPNTVKEAMAKGIKPVIQTFPGVSRVWPKRYVWNTIDDFCRMIQSKEYESAKYRKFMTGIHSYEYMRDNIKEIIKEYE